MTWKPRGHFSLCYLQRERLSNSTSLIQNAPSHRSRMNDFSRCLSRYYHKSVTTINRKTYTCVWYNVLSLTLHKRTHKISPWPLPTSIRTSNTLESKDYGVPRRLKISSVTKGLLKAFYDINMGRIDDPGYFRLQHSLGVREVEAYLRLPQGVQYDWSSRLSYEGTSGVKKNCVNSFFRTAK